MLPSPTGLLLVSISIPFVDQRPKGRFDEENDLEEHMMDELGRC